MISVADAGPAPISSMTGAPVVGYGDGAIDAFWYSPGAAPEWVSWGTGRDRFGREASSYSVSGTYVPLSGGAFESAGQGSSPGLSYLGRLVPAGYDVTSFFMWHDELW